MAMQLNDYGQMINLLHDQDSKKRVKGIEATKSNILAALGVAQTLRTSLGPKGMDKMLVSPDQQVTVSNDGATILEMMNIEHPIARLLVELSQSQDNETGDGTTGVVVLAGALLAQAKALINKGLHPLQITEGFEKAAEFCCKHLESIHSKIDILGNDSEELEKAAVTALGSKVVSKYQKELATISVQAILAVADLERKDVNFDLIKVEGKVGGGIEDTSIIQGIVLDKEFSHCQMEKEILDAKICILTCPFEPPKPKTKYNVEITSAENYKKLYDHEQNYFKEMVRLVKESGANLVICQWGFDDEANHLLMQEKLPAIRWVGGHEIELIALATGGRIIPRFSEISPEKLGRARLVKEKTFGTENDKIIVIEDCTANKAVTVLVRGGSTMIVDEARRALHDALCVVRNLLRDPRIVYGGGSPEISCAIAVNKFADTVSSSDQYAVRAFADALEQIPTALAENSGFSGIDYVATVKAEQVKQDNPHLGIDCMKKGTNNMKVQGVYEGLLSKIGQLNLATQVVKMILKIDDVITPDVMG